MIVLGIETSCDETGVAVYDARHGLCAHRLFSQAALHGDYGGVVPELASRDHVRKTLPMLRDAMQEAGVHKGDIGAVAYTAGPGLMGALLVGAAIGRSLAWAWGVPAVGVHHMEAHLLAPMLEDTAPEFPFVALLVSGGHTMLVRVDEVGRYTRLGDTLDDAVGEAFDKTGKLLGLPYPAGPALERLARQGTGQGLCFPRPMTDRPGLDFSFSGLKTHVVNTVRRLGTEAQARVEIARAFQDAVVDTLVIKCRRALRQTGLQRLVLAGGVSANTALRAAMSQMAEAEETTLYYPRPEFCTDNGAMIAYAGYLRARGGQGEPLPFTATPRWPLETLAPPSS